MQDRRLVIYDIETNGYFSDRTPYNQPIELAALVIEPDGKFEQYAQLIQCNKLFPHISNLTGITQQELNRRGAPLKEVVEKFSSWLAEDNYTLIGHNIIDCDNKFLNRELGRARLPLIRVENCFDTRLQMMADLRKRKKPMRLTHYAFQREQRKGGNALKTNLVAACKYYNIASPKNAHRALSDSYTTYLIFKEQAKRAFIIHQTIKQWKQTHQ